MFPPLGVPDVVLHTPTQPPLFEYHEGILKARAIDVLQRFYARGNPKAPDHKRERPLVEDK